MPNTTFVNPIDQPTGSFRLLDWLESNFKNKNFKNFRCLVAFAKINPFYKLHSSIQIWNNAQNTSEAIIGIDHKGTSYQALQYVMANFNVARILHVNYSTFHPKLYIFYGPSKATAYYGSSNLTSGGLETNFEGGVIIDFDFPNDKAEFDSLFKCYSSLLAPTVSCTQILTPSVLDQLRACNLLLDETQHNVSAPNTSVQARIPASPGTAPIWGAFPVKPARPIPKNIMVSAASNAGILLASTAKTKTSATVGSAVVPAVVPIVAGGFVTQITPHNNGEIHLSKLGVDQNKSFFGYPFNGTVNPKKAANLAYPQRIPDPVVNISVFDSTGTLVHTENNYNLNMVYYSAKSEIRITITPSILAGLGWKQGGTNFPILVMKLSNAPGIDYDMEFYAYGSVPYHNFFSMCNQTLPSGGKPVPRKMGWF